MITFAQMNWTKSSRLKAWQNAFNGCAVVAAVTLLATSPLRAEDTSGGLVPLKLSLPAPVFVGTPQDNPDTANVEPVSNKPRPPLMVPPGLKNVAPGSKVTCSDTNSTPEKIAKLTDGQKESSDANTASFRKGTQWVQFDLGGDQDIYAIVLWHAFDTLKAYHGVVVQVSDDPNFSDNVKTLFNDDARNLCGRGAGTNREYFETNEGKLIDAKGAKARYVRCYSHGSTDSALNEYVEVEIYAKPAQ